MTTGYSFPSSLGNPPSQPPTPPPIHFRKLVSWFQETGLSVRTKHFHSFLKSLLLSLLPRPCQPLSSLCPGSEETKKVLQAF